jgi:iron complex transport system ATP-binding protein
VANHERRRHRTRTRPILDIGHLRIEPNHFVGVVGRNGAGKSTLLHVLAGLIRPTAGLVRHDGTCITTLDGWRLSRLRRYVGLVPQVTEYHADLPLTVREVVQMGCAAPAGLLRAVPADARARVGVWLDRLGLSSLDRRTFRSLSGGEQQKVLLARAMVPDPRLLLLDEPGANLDMDWKERLVECLEDVLRERPLTVVMVSHETHLLPAACDRVVLIEAGRVVRGGPPDETLTPQVLSALYGCPVQVVSVNGRRHAVAGPDTTSPIEVNP